MKCNEDQKKLRDWRELRVASVQDASRNVVRRPQWDVVCLNVETKRRMGAIVTNPTIPCGLCPSGIMGHPSLARGGRCREADFSAPRLTMGL